MARLYDTFLGALTGYARYLVDDITQPTWRSYFYLLWLVSAVVFSLELARPWRPSQARFRRDFALDAFYMVFNFFLFSLLGYHAVASVVAQLFVDARTAAGIETLSLVDVSSLPVWAQLVLMLVFRDFVQYWIHRLLHRVPALWEFHKVHHSVREMGFAAHLRYHWVETVVYRTLEYIPLGLIGFGVQEFFAVHVLAISVGHLNHANLRVPIGPLRYVFNSPQMHLWHHAKGLPRRYGANFGLTLSVWDWVFGTVHWPADEPDVELGFTGVERYPSGFFGQMRAPFAALFGLRASAHAHEGAGDAQVEQQADDIDHRRDERG
ncbi:MAG: sterol desaturase family protein [Sandaracinaceae bacterium]